MYPYDSLREYVADLEKRGRYQDKRDRPGHL